MINPDLTDTAFGWFWRTDVRPFLLHWLEGSFYGRELVKGQAPTVGGSNVGIVATPFGRAVDFGETSRLRWTNLGNEDGDVGFSYAKKWTCFTGFSLDATSGDERTIFGKSPNGGVPGERQIQATTANMAAPADLRIFRGGSTTVVALLAVVEVATSYCLCVVNDGTGSLSGMTAILLGLGKGDVIASGTGQFSGDLEADEIHLGAHFSDTNDDIDGQIHFFYYLPGVQATLSQAQQLAANPFAPVVPVSRHYDLGAIAAAHAGREGAGQTIAIGLVTESDLALALSIVKLKTIGLVTEADSALLVTAIKLRTLGLVAETDSALALSASKTRNVGLVTEADSALALTAAKRKTLGQVTESDTAQPFTAVKLRTLGLVVETDTALSVTSGAGVPVGLVTETDAALGIAGAKVKAVGIVTEADSALAMVAQKLLTLGQVVEADSAFAVSVSKLINVGLAAETDTAQPIQPLRLYLLGLANETDAALPISAQRILPVGLAQELDSALAIARLKAKTLGIVTETDTALSITVVGITIDGQVVLASISIRQATLVSAGLRQAVVLSPTMRQAIITNASME